MEAARWVVALRQVVWRAFAAAPPPDDAGLAVGLPAPAPATAAAAAAAASLPPGDRPPAQPPQPAADGQSAAAELSVEAVGQPQRGSPASSSWRLEAGGGEAVGAEGAPGARPEVQAEDAPSSPTHSSPSSAETVAEEGGAEATGAEAGAGGEDFDEGGGPVEAGAGGDLI